MQHEIGLELQEIAAEIGPGMSPNARKSGHEIGSQGRVSLARTGNPSGFE